MKNEKKKEKERKRKKKKEKERKKAKEIKRGRILSSEEQEKCKGKSPC